MGRTACCVVLVCVLVVAGCSGFDSGLEPGVGSGGKGESGVSVTPAPVPAADGTERLAPGLTDAGVDNASALGAAHNAILRNRSFTIRTNQTTTYANGSLRGRTIGTARVVPNETAFRASGRTNGTRLVSRSTDGSLVRNERWFGGREGFATGTFANGTTRYYRFENNVGPAIVQSYTDRGDRYERLLDGAETRVTGQIERDGTTLYRLRSSEPSSSEPIQLPWFESVENATFEALVSSNGFVYRHRLTYTLRTENGSTLRIVESVRYSDVGSTTVERPPWYGEALDRTNATDG